LDEGFCYTQLRWEEAPAEATRPAPVVAPLGDA
jgi:hypothetical protein